MGREARLRGYASGRAGWGQKHSGGRKVNRNGPWRAIFWSFCA